MLRTHIRLLALLLALPILAACGKDQAPAPTPASGNAEPAAAILTQAKLLNAGDFDALAKAALPPDDYQALRKQFVLQQQQQEPLTEEQRAEFAHNMEMLRAPDAEQKLFARVEPLLEQYDSKYRAMVPMYVGMGQTMLATGINQSKELTPEQKKQASDVLAAAAQWAQNTNWGDPAKAREAIAIITGTARALDIETLEQARALTWDQATEKYAQAWNGLRQVLAVYGLDINHALDTVTAKTLQQDGHNATVEVAFTLFDKPMTSSVNMVERDGHWYNADLLEDLEDSLSEAAAGAPADAASAPSHAGTAD